jgi:hypothetical protein
MSSGVPKFSILKGVENTFVFTIKQDDSTLPLVITAGDTFYADLIELGSDNTFSGVSNKLLEIDSNLSSGRVRLVLTAANTIGMVSEKGGKEDRYYQRPTYKLIIKCNTANNGSFLVKVPEVYVE